VSIRDNGKKIISNIEEHKGLGMMNMKHRTSLLGGKIRWHSPEGNGVQVEILVPIPRNSA
jgi:signal transduction histidine kinase